MTNDVGTDGKPKRSHVERRINEGEAVIVRRIFQLYGAGTGLTTLAKTLNHDHVPPPGGRAHGWVPSAIREMLRRELYRGVSIWNQTQSVQIGGTKKQRQRPESEWLRVDVPHLRMVSDEEWRKVQGRIQECATVYHRGYSGRLQNGPTGRVHNSQYLLSGLAQCGLCGKSMVGISTKRKGYVYKKYGCVCYQKRGAIICRNKLKIGQADMDRAVLLALQQALDPQVLEESVQLALAQIESDSPAQASKRKILEQEAVEIDRRIERLTEAIAAIGGSDTLYEKLRAEEGRKQVVQAQLSTMTEAEKVSSLDTTRLVQDLRARVHDLQGLLTRQVSEARKILKTTLNGSLIFQPVEIGGKAGYRFYGTGSYGSLLAYSQAANDSGGGQGS